MILKLNKAVVGIGLTVICSTHVYADVCQSAQLNDVLAPSTAKKSVSLKCSLQLPKNAKVTKQIIFEGQSSSDITLDCNGASIESTSNPAILIQSVKQAQGWAVPKNITIKNCTINGAIRIHGMGRNGESAEVKASSISQGHTQRVVQAAPSNIILDNLTLLAGNSNMLYLAPGVNQVTVKNSKFKGQAGSLAIYLDAESQYNRIENNIFDVQTPSRELIAVDGSAHNVISGNQFIHPKHGAIYLYRNCGEGGTIRHQTPSYNLITHNSFKLNKPLKQPMIWLGSRNGNRNYCDLDQGYAFGSSQSDLDYAEHNEVKQNQLQLKKAKWYEFWLSWNRINPIQSNSLNNTIVNNQISYK